MTVFAYETGDPHNPLGSVGPDEVAHLPFGALELDCEGRVLSYNDTEPDDGSHAKTSLVGKNFFADIARWAGNSIIAEEFRKGIDANSLNVVFDCAVGSLPYKVRLHLKISPILGTYWVFIKKLHRA